MATDLSRKTHRRRTASSLGVLLLIAYAVACGYRAWFNPSGAHGQRQVDTAGMSQALYLDMRNEGPITAAARTLISPRVLQRGASSGVNAAEFPVLTVLTAPFFVLGPHLGNYLGSLFILLLNFLAALILVPKFLRNWNVALPVWLCALLYFSIGSIEFQSAIFMPEGLAFPLLLLGATGVTSHRLTPGRAVGTWLSLTLAVAIKPTAVVGYAVLAMFPLLHLGLRLRLKLLKLWPQAEATPLPKGHFDPRVFYGLLASSLIFPAWWYGPHAHALLAQVDGPQVFALAGFDPIHKLQSVGARSIVAILLRQLNNGQIPMYTGLLWAVSGLLLDRPVYFTLIASILGAIALDGFHIWFHAYYFFGAGLASLVFLGRGLSKSGERPLLRALLLLSIFWGAAYGIRNQVWVAARMQNWWNFVKPLQAAASSLDAEATRFVTDDVAACPTKLLLMGRIGEIAYVPLTDYCDKAGYRRHGIAFVLEQSHWAELKRTRKLACLSHAETLAEAKSADGDWVLVYLRGLRPPLPSRSR